jgi:dienelactone hydrolase
LHLQVYISKPADYPHTPARLLLLLTGGTGLHSVNNQLQADQFATHGYVVVMPDLFAGDPAPNSRVETASHETSLPSGDGAGSGTGSLLDTLRLKAAETAKSFLIDMWLARHTEEKVMPILEKVLDGAGDEFADAVSHGGGVYAVGYCFGARYILLLAAEKKGPGGKQQSAGGEGDEEAGVVAPRIKAGALAHATLVSKRDWEGLRAPLSVVSVENDPLFPDEVRIAGEEYMSGNGVEHEVQVYPGVPHGELNSYPDFMWDDRLTMGRLRRRGRVRGRQHQDRAGHCVRPDAEMDQRALASGFFVGVPVRLGLFSPRRRAGITASYFFLTRLEM